MVYHQVLMRALSLNFEKFDGAQHFTQPPAHFTEVSLVKVLGRVGYRTSKVLTRLP